MGSAANNHAADPRVAGLLAEADAIAGLVAGRADEIEQARRLPADLSRRFADAGLYRLLVPAAFGGLEVHPQLFVDIVERIARADGSSAWCVFVGATAATMSAYLPEREARAVFSDQQVLVAGVFAPRGRAFRHTRGGVEGYLVSGRWQWGSGANNAGYITGGCLVLDAGGAPEKLPTGRPQVRSVLFDAADVALIDTWQVSGLAGTGSVDFEAKEVFVPQARTCSFLSDKPLPGALYCFPVFGLLAIGIAATCLGMARGAIDELVALAGAKKPDASARVLAERASTQLKVAEAEAMVRSARAFLAQAIEAAWGEALAGGAIAIDRRRDLRLATTHAVRESARAIDLMYQLGGGTSVYRRSPLQRYFRDVHAATQHMMVGESTLELAGRLFLGLPSDVTTL
jgi:alkylation response protein AidB-like acyl-CoA dehydrogenase